GADLAGRRIQSVGQDSLPSGAESCPLWSVLLRIKEWTGRMSRALGEMSLMSTATADQGPERRRGPHFGEAEERELASLFRLWREESRLAASEERRFAVGLNSLVMSRALEGLDDGAFLRLVQPFAGPVELSDEEKQFLILRVRPLLETRELTKGEKD